MGAGGRDHACVLGLAHHNLLAAAAALCPCAEAAAASHAAGVASAAAEIGAAHADAAAQPASGQPCVWSCAWNACQALAREAPRHWE